MRWAGTVFYLIGMMLTSANVYPLNLVFGGIGGLLWCLVGLKWNDRALILVEAASAGIYFFGLIHWFINTGTAT